MDIDPAEYVPEHDPEFEEILYGSLGRSWEDFPELYHAYIVSAEGPGWIGEISAE
jgi:hypothetical protein